MRPSKASGLVRYAIRDVVAAAKKEGAKGKRIIYLNIGDPCQFGFSPPRRILEAVSEAALSAKYAHYAPSAGDPELREEIARAEGCAKENVFVTAGLSEGIDFSMRVLLDKGDSILLPNPTYPLYPTKADIFGAKSLYYDCDEEWAPDIDQIRKKKDSRTRAIVVINPNNPTGAVYPRKVLEEIADFAAEEEIAIIADEVYDHLVFAEGKKMHKMKDIAKDVPVFSGNSLSKVYLYPGARVGYMALHNESAEIFADPMLRMCNQRLSINGELQRGAIAAYRGNFDFLSPTLKKLKKRSGIISGMVNEIPGLSVVSPSAALYAFVKVEGYAPKGNYDKRRDWNFVYDLLHEEGILAVPGSAFYKNHEKELYFRTTFLPREDELEAAMGKIGRFMRTRTRK
jgi:aspartate/methionine/tyrosine aminotransferase